MLLEAGRPLYMCSRRGVLGRVSRVQVVCCSVHDYLCSSKMNRASMVLMLLLSHCSSFGLGCEVRDGMGLPAGVSSLMMQARFDPACKWSRYLGTGNPSAANLDF